MLFRFANPSVNLAIDSSLYRGESEFFAIYWVKGQCPLRLFCFFSRRREKNENFFFIFKEKVVKKESQIEKADTI